MAMQSSLYFWFVVVALLCQGVVWGQHAACTDGWAYHRESCYRAFDQRASFEDALCECAIHNAELAMAQDADTEAFLTQLAREKTTLRGVWVAGDDKEEEGRFVNFFTSQPLEINYVKWFPGQPDGGARENCVAKILIWNWQWTDLGCSGDIAFICRRGANAVLTNPTGPIVG